MSDMSLHNQIKALFSDVILERSQMHDYQHTAYRFLKANPFSGLFIEMGLGKTVSSATVVVDLLNDFGIGDNKKVLIVGPKKVALTTWPDEFRQWRHLAPFVPEVIHVADDDARLKACFRESKAYANNALHYVGNECDKYARDCVATLKNALRSNLAKSKRQIHIISRDWLEWLVDFYGPRWPYEIVIIDESSGFKDHKSGRFEALKSVRMQPSNPIKRLHILTATPATEGYEGLFSQIFLLDCGKRLGRTITNYRDKYFTENRYSRKLKLRPGAETAILAKISDICLVMKEKDYLEREEPLFVERVVKMDEAQMRQYMTMQEKHVLTMSDGSTVKAETAAALSQKLLQMASGVLYDTQLLPGQDEDDDHAKVLKIHRIHDHKIDELKQIVEEAQGKTIMVVYHHRSSKDRLLANFPQMKIMDADGKLKKPWNEGKIPMLGIHPASGGHGLNLQHGGHIIVFFDIPWSRENYVQVIGRLSRQGQKFRVTVFLIVCKDTLDRTVVEALRSKGDVQEKLFNIMQKMRRKLKTLLKSMRTKPTTEEDWAAMREALTDYGESEDFAEDEL